MTIAARHIPKVGLVSLGCPKALVDSECILTQLRAEGYMISPGYDAADVVIIADIFPARERDTGLIHSRELVIALAERPRFVQGGAQVYHGGDVGETGQVLTTVLHSGDLAVIMGAGDIYSVADQLLHAAKRGERWEAI